MEEQLEHAEEKVPSSNISLDNDIAIFIAAEMGDLDKVRAFYNMNQSIECKWNFKLNGEPYNGWATPLMYACRSGHFEMVKYLIENCKANINAKDCESWTALHYTSINNHFNIVSYLLNHNVNTDVIAVYEKCTAEGFAKYRRFTETVQVFDEFFNRKLKTEILAYNNEEQFNICKRQIDKLQRGVILDKSNNFKQCKYIKRYIVDEKSYHAIVKNIGKVTDNEDVIFCAWDIVYKLDTNDKSNGIVVWIRICRDFKRYLSIVHCLKENKINVYRSNSLSGIHHIIVIPRGDNIDKDNGFNILVDKNNKNVHVDLVYHDLK